jgi:hypothetical protein
MRVQHFVRFNCENAHGGDGPRSTFLAKGAVVCEGYFVVCVECLKGGLLFSEAAKPDVPIGVDVGESGEKGARTFPHEACGADKVRDGLRICGAPDE